MPPPSPNSRPILFTEIEQFGGAERAALALCRWLSTSGLENHIVAYEDRCNLAAFPASTVEVIQLHPAASTSSKVRALRQYFASRPSSAPRPLLSGYQPALHATLAGLRGFHVLMHDTPSLFDDPTRRDLKHRTRRFVSNKIVGFGLRSGGQTIVTSEFLRDECLRDFRVRAEIARMGGFPYTSFPHQPLNSGSLFHMLSVSRLEPNKRLHWLLQALSELERAPIAPLAAPLSQLVDWRFDIAGQGPQFKELHTLAEQLGIDQRVHFHGFVSDAALENLYRQASLFLMPAQQGYGIPAIESLSRHIPVLLHRDSGVSDILLNTPWATVFAGGADRTAAALAEAIHNALHNRLIAHLLPELPTEDAWAKRVAALCGWTA